MPENGEPRKLDYHVQEKPQPLQIGDLILNVFIAFLNTFIVGFAVLMYGWLR